jgi:hypothetical protein
MTKPLPNVLCRGQNSYRINDATGKPIGLGRRRSARGCCSAQPYCNGSF